MSQTNNSHPKNKINNIFNTDCMRIRRTLREEPSNSNNNHDNKQKISPQHLLEKDQILKATLSQVVDDIQHSDQDQMQWKGIYIDGKFYLAEPVSINMLLSLQKQIQIEKIMAFKFKDQHVKQGNSRIQSSQSYFQSEVPNKSNQCKTQINYVIQNLKKQQIQMELEREEQKYLHRIQIIKNKAKNVELQKNSIRISKNKHKEVKNQKQQKKSSKNSQKNQKKPKMAINLLVEEKVDTNMYVTPKFEIKQARPIETSKLHSLPYKLAESKNFNSIENSLEANVFESNTNKFNILINEPTNQIFEEELSILNLQSHEEKLINETQPLTPNEYIFSKLQHKIEQLEQKISHIEQKQAEELLVIQPNSRFSNIQQSKAMLSTKGPEKTRKVNFIDQSKVMVHTKYQPENEVISEQSKLSLQKKSQLNLAHSIISYNLTKNQTKTQQFHQNQELKLQMQNQIVELKKTVKELKIQKIKCNAQLQQKREILENQILPAELRNNYEEKTFERSSFQNNSEEPVDTQRQNTNLERRLEGSIVHNMSKTHVSRFQHDSTSKKQNAKSMFRERLSIGKIIKNPSLLKNRQEAQQGSPKSDTKSEKSLNKQQNIEYVIIKEPPQRTNHHDLQQNTPEHQAFQNRVVEENQQNNPTERKQTVIDELKQFQTIQIKPDNTDNLQQINQKNQFQNAMPIPLKKNSLINSERFIIKKQSNQNAIKLETIRSKEIRTKLINKFENNQKKFTNFIKNQSEKKNRYQNKEENKDLKKSDSKSIENPQKTLRRRILDVQKSKRTASAHKHGFIIKNSTISHDKSFAEDKKQRKSSTQQINDEKLYLPKTQKLFYKENSSNSQRKKSFALQSQENEKRQLIENKEDDNDFTIKDFPRIQFSFVEIPEIPEPPKPNTTLEDTIDLIKQLCKVISIKIDQKELSKLVMKRYKNCHMFGLTSDQKIKVIWHYSGKLYVGDWNQEKSEKTGQGIEFVKDKFYYKGQFLNGKKHGSGIQVQSNGNIYEGQWLEGEKNGGGKSYEKSLNMFYEGEWKNNRKQGYGFLKISEKEYYKGLFVNNVKHGYGIESFSNDDKYKGQYANGSFHGKGIYRWSNGSFYQGEFEENNKNGFGKWQSARQNYDTYIGDYVKDQKHGVGKYMWANGCIYEGQFKNDIKHGKGEVQYPDGRIMAGLWTEGVLVEVLSKLNEAHKQQPLDAKKNHAVQTTTIIKIVQSPSKEIQLSSKLNKF